MQHFDLIHFGWNDSVREQLLGQGLKRLPHAMLLIGPAGVGKSAFSQQLAALLLCEDVTTQQTACGICQACTWLDAGNHPDFRRVSPNGDADAEEGSIEKSEKSKKRSTNIIRIDQIRELEGFVFTGSHRNGNRVVLITEAEAMNAPAANSLLKILEEPPVNVYFILVSSKYKSLLSTIRSRCRCIPFGSPDTTTATEWLAEKGLQSQASRYLDLAGGAPMRVVQWSEQGQLAPMAALVDTLMSPPTDPIALAARWDGLLKGDGLYRMEHLVEGVQRWLFDLAQERVTGQVRYHGGWQRPKGVENLNPQALLLAWREFNQFRRSARHPLNQLLFLENMAAHFLRALRPLVS